MLVLAPASEAREPRDGPIHFEAQGSQHPTHNPADCAICIAMQLVALPGRGTPVPAITVAGNVAPTHTLPQHRIQAPFVLTPSRAPPQLA